MADATLTHDFTERLPPGMAGVKLTTTGTTSTYRCPYFSKIIGVVPNNESDTDGVGIGVAIGTSIITITVATSGDVVTLLISGIS